MNRLASGFRAGVSIKRSKHAYTKKPGRTQSEGDIGFLGGNRTLAALAYISLWIGESGNSRSRKPNKPCCDSHQGQRCAASGLYSFLQIYAGDGPKKTLLNAIFVASQLASANQQVAKL